MFAIRSIRAVKKDLKRLSPEVLKEIKRFISKTSVKIPFGLMNWDTRSGDCDLIISDIERGAS